MSIAIKAEHVSKLYRLGVINHGMLYKDIQSYLARKFGKPDPHAKIGKEFHDDGIDHYWALKDVSFEIEKGDRVGIIGKNGAGKSTLLKILSRITAPTEGRIKVKGRIASLLEVGTGFHPELTGRENIYLNGAILGMKRAQIAKKLDAIIDFSEIEKYIDTPVKRYSSGMYVRLAFAVAAHLDSDILLADEVLAVGDAAFQKKCLGKMEDVSKNQGRTVLFVSHNMAAVQSLCVNAMLLENGRIADYSDISTIIQKYSMPTAKTTNAKISVINYPRPKGREKIITECWIENDKKEICNMILMGEGVNICFKIHSLRSLSDVGFGFAIETVLGEMVTSFGSYIEKTERYNGIQDGVVRFRISELPLFPGKYLLSFGVTEKRSIALDRVERCISLNVVENDFFKTGMIYERAHGYFYLKPSLEIIN